MNQRLAAKEKRKRRILASAHECIVKGGIDSLSMRGLAETAHVSVRTLYNLFGNKDDILEALVAKLRGQLKQEVGQLVLDDPIARCKAIIRLSVESLIDEQDLYRPVVRAQKRRLFSNNDADRRSVQAIRAAIEDAARKRRLTGHIAPENLAHQMYFCHKHSVLLWAHGELDSRQFRAAAMHSCSLFLLAAGTPETRRKILAELPALERELSLANRTSVERRAMSRAVATTS